MKNIALFANTDVGLKVAKFLDNDKEVTVKYLFLSGQYKTIDQEIYNVFKDKNTVVYTNSSKDISGKINDSKLDFHITVYWPYLLDQPTIAKAKSSVNFHPALLPINRGWYPHVHSIIDGSKSGVTLHKINEEADRGDIWAQKEVLLPVHFTAKDAYLILQNEMVEIFEGNWNKIKNSKIQLIKQDEAQANYHKKNEINELDFIDILNNKEYLKLINLLRARSFGDYGFSYFIDQNGEKIYMNIRLSKTNKF